MILNTKDQIKRLNSLIKAQNPILINDPTNLDVITQLLKDIDDSGIEEFGNITSDGIIIDINIKDETFIIDMLTINIDFEYLFRKIFQLNGSDFVNTSVYGEEDLRMIRISLNNKVKYVYNPFGYIYH